MIDTWTAVAVPAPRATLAEGPWWDERAARLLWVDIPAGRVHTHVPGTAQATTPAVTLPAAVGFVLGRDHGGGFVAGTADGLVALDEDLAPAGLLGVPPDLDADRRINDGVADPQGRILFGTVDPSGLRTGTIWSCAGDGTFTALITEVAMANGLGFSPDGRWLYAVDTPTGRVDRLRYDPSTGRASERECFFRVPDDALLPDGLAVDADGNVWLALWGAGEVWRLSPAGVRTGVVRVPAALTTSCAFGGPGRDRLYVTAAAPDRDEASAGSLFVADVGVIGSRPWTASP